MPRYSSAHAIPLGKSNENAKFFIQKIEPRLQRKDFAVWGKRLIFV